MFEGIVGFIMLLLVIFLVVGIVTGNLFYVVKQQHAVIIERLGRWTARRPRSACAR